MKNKMIALLLIMILTLSFAAPALAVPSNVSYATTRAALTALDEADIYYSYTGIDGSGNEKVTLSYTLNNTDIDILVFFAEDLTSAHMRVWNYIKYDALDYLNVVKACDEVNGAYKWTTFYTEDDNTVTVKLDIRMNPSCAGELMMANLSSLINICDEAFPTLSPYNK